MDKEEADREVAKMRASMDQVGESIKEIGNTVSNYYLQLTRNGVPKSLAGALAIDLQKTFLDAFKAPPPS